MTISISPAGPIRGGEYDPLPAGGHCKEGTLSTARTDEYYEMLTQGRTPLSLTAGDVIFRQGDQGDAMYVLRQGSVALKAGDRVVAIVEAPDLFGEMALVDDEPRTLTAVAATDAVLVEIPARHFWILVHDTPYFAQLVMSVMAQRIRRQGGST